MAGLLYGVEPHDPLTFSLIPGFFVLFAFVGTYVPARRAARVQPVSALRGE